MGIKSTVKRVVATVALSLIYLFAIVIGKLFGWLMKPKSSSNAVIINATFHNPNWFFAHIEPLARANYGPVVLITDEIIAEVPNLTYECPPKWLSTLATRAGAKFIWTLIKGIQYKGDIFVGYHIFPSAVTALICSRLLRARCVYQVTAGELELEGGGWNAENPLMRMLQKPSKWVERMALGLTRQFDLVVVRGSRAKRFIREGGRAGPIEIITGSVELPDITPTRATYDVITVGRLAEYKRPDLFVDMIAQLVKTHPNVKAAMVGEGPDRAALESQIDRLGIRSNITLLGQRKDVMDLFSESKVFVLTSRWEGVSIAMLESMGMGLVPVVSRVGDLSDFAENDVTGYVVDFGDIDAYAQRIATLLDDDALFNTLSTAASERVLARAERGALSARWFNVMTTLNNGQ